MPALRLAVFISPHGFGHAARACALMERLGALSPLPLHFVIFASTPEWFLEQSLSVPFEQRHERVDVGLIQLDPLREDMTATTAAVAELYDACDAHVERLALALHRSRCRGVIADIAPLGLAAAAAAGLPAALVENFTWDWIYRLHPQAPPTLQAYGDLISGMNMLATLHVQTDPVCAPLAGAERVGSIARAPRRAREPTRAALGVSPGERLVLVSLGGIQMKLSMPLRVPDGCRVLLLGDSDDVPVPGVQVLAGTGGHYHPDLACAADVIVGKLGYSTLAEAWQAGCGLVWARRPDFAETEVLARHARRTLRHAEIGPDDLSSGRWIEAIGDLAPPHAPEPFRDGAATAARAILMLVGA